jgi:hypothetical protein
MRRKWGRWGVVRREDFNQTERDKKDEEHVASLVLESGEIQESGVPVSSPHGSIRDGSPRGWPLSARLHARLGQRMKLLLDD